MIVGQSIRVTKAKTKEKDFIENLTGRIYALTKYLITVEYMKDGKPTHREAFNIANIIEKKVVIEVKEGNEWTRVEKSYFKR